MLRPPSVETTNLNLEAGPSRIGLLPKLSDQLKKQVGLWVQLAGLAAGVMVLGKIYTEHNINTIEIAALRAKVMLMSEQLVRIDEKLQQLLKRP